MACFVGLMYGLKPAPYNARVFPWPFSRGDCIAAGGFAASLGADLEVRATAGREAGATVASNLPGTAATCRKTWATRPMCKLALVTSLLRLKIKEANDGIFHPARGRFGPFRI